MQAGKLRHRVTLQQKTAGSPQRSPSGAPDESWADLAEVWASIEPFQGKEFVESLQLQSEVSVRIRIRHRSDVTAAMRATHGGKIYSIEAVINPNERNQELLLMCSEGANAG